MPCLSLSPSPDLASAGCLAPLALCSPRRSTRHHHPDNVHHPGPRGKQHDQITRQEDHGSRHPQPRATQGFQPLVPLVSRLGPPRRLAGLGAQRPAAPSLSIALRAAVFLVVTRRRVFLIGLSSEMEPAARVTTASGPRATTTTAAAVKGETASWEAAAAAEAALTHHGKQDLGVDAAAHATAAKHVRVHQVIAAVVAGALPKEIVSIKPRTASHGGATY